MYKEFKELEHRPYALPSSPWVLTQVWRDLLFMHYPLSPDLIKSYIPRRLELDTFQNEAWISIIPFRITNMRARGLPPIPFINSYLELNVRTYAIYKGIPGIYFFSLDADHPLAVLGGRTVTGLPYKQATMSYQKNGKDIEFASHRIDGSEKLKVSYRTGPILFEPLPGSIDHWLLERYCMYSCRGDVLLRGDIHHDKWKVTTAESSTKTNTMVSFLPGEPPLLHYSSRRRFFVYPLKKV
ncbi:YqjF family protein [Bacillus sp. V59.32b]|uniref:YqjF family protein n=1 Tax=Bacillus sp. V59.32b TaxID=1758642 RepID=UPI0013589CDD|nr:DUF2071 domain-containing protein [Bacillus sp. V59.32b]